MNKYTYTKRIEYYFKKNYRRLYSQCDKVLATVPSLQTVVPPLSALDILNDYWYFVEQSPFHFQSNHKEIINGMFYPDFLFFVRKKYKDKGISLFTDFKPTIVLQGYPEHLVYMALAELPRHTARTIVMTKYFSYDEIQTLLGYKSIQVVHNQISIFKRYMREHIKELEKKYQQILENRYKRNDDIKEE